MDAYTYRLILDDKKTVRVEKEGPQRKDLGKPRGALAATPIADVLQACFSGAKPTPSEEEIRQLGEQLFDLLFDTGLQTDFFALYEQARKEKRLLRIELDIDEAGLPGLAALPWEFLRVSGTNNRRRGLAWPATDPNVVFSRTRRLWDPAEPVILKPGEKLRIALATAAPNGMGTVAYEEVWQALKELAAEQPDRVELLPLVEQATPDLIDELLKKAPHIFHFIGHGVLGTDDETAEPRGFIYLVDSTGGAFPYRAEGFGELFVRSRPGIVFLQACQGAAASTTRAFVHVASHVIDQNIPVVVAMQYEISNSSARRFAKAFYQALAEDKAVDQAVQEGRRKLAIGPRGYDNIDFATPVLFMRVPDGQIFARDTAQAANGKDDKNQQPTGNQVEHKSWTVAEKFKLVELLLQTQSMSDRHTRDMVIGQLPANLRGNIRHNPADKFHVLSIVETCLNYAGGMRALLDILTALEGDSAAVVEVREYLEG